MILSAAGAAVVSPEIEPGPPRRNLDRFLESAGCLIDPAHLLQYATEIVVRCKRARLNRKRLLAMLYGFLVLVQCLKRGRAICMSWHQAGCGGERLAIARDRFAMLLRCLERVPEIVICRR